MSVKNVPTIEILEMLNYMKVRNCWKEYTFLYDEYLSELADRIHPLINIY